MDLNIKKRTRKRLFYPGISLSSGNPDECKVLKDRRLEIVCGKLYVRDILKADKFSLLSENLALKKNKKNIKIK
jgi:hypothetical protein